MGTFCQKQSLVLRTNTKIKSRVHNQGVTRLGVPNRGGVPKWGVPDLVGFWGPAKGSSRGIQPLGSQALGANFASLHKLGPSPGLQSGGPAWGSVPGVQPGSQTLERLKFKTKPYSSTALQSIVIPLNKAAFWTKAQSLVLFRELRQLYLIV